MLRTSVFNDPNFADGRRYKIESFESTPQQQLLWLRPHWSSIYQTGDFGPFMQWDFVEAWLNSLDESQSFLSVIAYLDHPENEWHGKACLILTGAFRRGEWYPMRTGEPALDQVWVEYTDWLSNPMNPMKLTTVAYQHLVQHHKLGCSHWNVVCSERPIHNFYRSMSRNSWCVTHDTDRGFFVPIGQIPPSAMRTSSLNRSLRKTKEIAEQQKWSLQRIIGDNAWDVLSKASAWHVDKWRDTPTPSGFLNPHFVNFHERLFRETSIPVLFSVTREDTGELIGAIYCMNHKKTLSFYLGAYATSTDPKIKLGLWSHAMIIDWCETSGFKEYDFMAGDANYKKSFSSFSRNFMSFSLYRKQFKYLFFPLKQWVSGLIQTLIK